MFGEQVIPDFFRSEELALDNLSSEEDEPIVPTNHAVIQEVILSDVEFGVGARVYIINKISHFKEKGEHPNNTVLGL